MSYSKPHRHSKSYWNGFPLTLHLVLLLLFTHPAFLVDGIVLNDPKDVVNDFYSRYNVTDQTDLVFVLDQSSSVSRIGWISMINFVKNLLDHFVIDRNHVRVAIVTFSSSTDVKLDNVEPGPATDNSTKCTVYEHLRQMINSVRLSGHAATYAALDEAYQILLNSRPNAKKAVFLLTDSPSNIGDSPQKMAGRIKSLSWSQSWNSSLFGPQVEIYSLGIAAASVDELRSIASDLPLHYLHFPDFTMFTQFTRDLRKKQVPEQWIDADSNSCDGQTCRQENTKCMCGTWTGQFSCACPPGYESDGLRCKVCQQGYYKEGYVPEPCKSCPQNHTTSGVGASNLRDCHPLPGQRRCPELPDIPHGFKFFVSGDLVEEVANTGLDCKDVRDGNSCHYECEDGYRLFNGTKVMKCNAWGEWIGTTPYCKMIDCEPMSESWANQSRFALTYANRTTTYQSVVFASCWPGLVALGQTTWICGKNGWSRPWNFECKEVFCSPLVPAEFSDMVPPVCANTTQRLGFECQMICRDGFRQIGPGNYSCDFEGRTFWKPRAGEEGQTICRDIQAPVITCPDDIVVESDSDVDNCSTVVDYDRDVPDIYDNSGNASCRITGEPANKTFCLGQALLTYEAFDKTGNRDTCRRVIIVKEKSGKVIRCPDDIAMLSNSSERRRVVFWPEPIFHGRHGDPLPHNCTHTAGTEFQSGVTTVVCAPTVPYQGSNCKFKVSISDPPCSLPFPDRMPVNGNITCLSEIFHVKSCTIKCHDGFEMIDSQLQNQKFFCFWDGSWSLQQPWPECYRSRRPSEAIANHRMTVTLNSSCTEQKRPKVIDAFIGKVDAVLKDPQGPCKPPCKCSIQEVDFQCSSSSGSRGSESSSGDPTSDPLPTEESVTLSPESRAENFTLRFVLKGVIRPVNRPVIVKSDQKQIDDALFDVFLHLDDMVSERQFFLLADDLLVTVMEMVEGVSEFIGLNCSGTELRRMEEHDFACFVCPVGTYFVNGSNNASSACVPCPLGFYKDQEGGQQCRSCGPDRNTTNLGARNTSECLDPCPPGYSSITGYEPCSQCVQGTYQTESRSTECLRCPQNQTTQSDGATSLDDCFETVPCDDHNRTCGLRGSCIIKKGDLSCLCDAGFDGVECNTDIDECEHSHCQNHGTCVDRIAGYECQCSSSFTGERCEIEVDECASMPCRNGGSCIDGRDSYVCVCLPGFEGSYCQDNIDECASHPCNNGSCLDGTNSFTCSCYGGYTGDRCDKLIDFCVHETCFNGGRCVGSANGTRCLCAKGYTGLKCESEVNACSSDPCLNQGFCIKELDAFHCRCLPGFIGETCSLAVSPDFDLVFPEPSVSNYVLMRLRLNGSSLLRQVSVCTWMRTADVRNYGTAWSYSAENNWLSADSANVLTAYDYGNLQFFVNGHVVATNLSLNDGTWHHLCLTWNGETGDWAVYINGTYRRSGHDLATGTYINANGYLVLGQEQDNIGGGFDIQDSFVGELSQFAVFDYALEAEEIARMALVGSEGCLAVQGNVLSWTSVLDNIKGNVIRRNTSWCMDVNECNFASLNVCTGDTHCQDTKGSYLCVPCESSECLKPNDDSRICATNPCQNGGTCQPDVTTYQCLCAPGYTGRRCTDAAISCDPNPCQNGGSCNSSGGAARCWCVQPWVGRYCHVRYWQTCDAQPCFNNGTCIPDVIHGYRCLCPANQSLGADCGDVKACDSSPCQSRGTCINLSIPPGYQCECMPHFSGRNCEVDVIASTTVSAMCLNVDCKNGGTCVIEKGNYVCKCSGDYRGQYCDDLRNSESKVYHVVVKLNEPYNEQLRFNKTFEDTFRQQIHQLYTPMLRSGRLHVKINNIREGSVIVEFDLTHTYYLDETNPGEVVMRNTLQDELGKFQLGTYKATPDGFVFVAKEDVSTSSSALYASVIVIVVIIVAAVISVLLWWYIKRYRPARKMRTKLSNPMRVSNPMYHGDFSSPSPRTNNIQEDLYCEPRELLPYATSEDSDKDSDPGASCQNKRKKKNWHLRQSIPLPPKPDEAAQASSFCSGRSIDEMNRATPPPPYYPSHGHGPDLPPIPPARDLPRNSTPSSSRHNYANEPPQPAADSCYFMPLSDEEAELIKHPETISDNPGFEMESAYLIPRRPVEEEEETTEAIEMTYLEPVRDTPATSDKTESKISDADKCNDSNDVMYAIRSMSCDAPVPDDVTGTSRQQTG